MRVIIAGVGDMGSYIARYLIEEDFDVTIIDMDVNKVISMSDNEAVAGIIGDVLDSETLESAGIRSTDIFIATTNSDEVNILACQLSDNFGVNYNICGLKDSKYQSNEWKKIFSYISDVISLDHDITKSIFEQIKHSYLKIANILTFFNDEIKMFSINCNENSTAINKTISSIYEALEENIPFKIVGLQRNNNYIIPSENDIITENDEIFLVVQEKHIKYVYSLFFNLEQSENKFLESQSPNIIISGDHPFIKSLSISLSRFYNRVKIVTNSKNESKNMLMAMDLERHGIQIIEDDITKNEYRNNYIKSEDDIIIIINKNDNDSLLKTMFLKYQSVGNLFCYINNDSYKNFLSSSKINNIITTNYYIMSPILFHIRRGVIMNAYSINNKIEAMEIAVNEVSKIVGKKISDIEESRKLTIAMLIDEKGKVIIFNENTVIKSQYHIIIIALRKHIPFLEENFLQNIDS